MPEEQTETTTNKTPPPVDTDKIKADAIREGEERARRFFEDQKPTLVKEAEEAARKKIVEALNPSTEEKINPSTSRLLTETDAVLGIVVQTAVDAALEQMDRKQAQRDVVGAMYQKRPDIAQSTIAQTAIGVFYGQIMRGSPEKNPDVALKEAMDRYDHEAGTSSALRSSTTEQTGISSTGSSGSGGGIGDTSDSSPKTEDELLKEEMKEKLDAQRSKRKGYST